MRKRKHNPTVVAVKVNRRFIVGDKYYLAELDGVNRVEVLSEPYILNGVEVIDVTDANHRFLATEKYAIGLVGYGSDELVTSQYNRIHYSREDALKAVELLKQRLSGLVKTTHDGQLEQLAIRGGEVFEAHTPESLSYLEEGKPPVLGELRNKQFAGRLKKPVGEVLKELVGIPPDKK